MTSQSRAVQNYRGRLKKKGIARFEVIGLDRDRDLIRSLARQLSEDNGEATQLRATVAKAVAPSSQAIGGVLAALRRSPLAVAELDLVRPRHGGRKVDL